MLTLFLLLVVLTEYSEAVCQFQNPFYFLERPSVVTVVDSSGQMVADRVRVTWGRVQNFKCVDYYQIEYWNEEEPDESFAISEKINRHRKSHDITIKPCRNYLFKVRLGAASGELSLQCIIDRSSPQRTGGGGGRTTGGAPTPSSSGWTTLPSSSDLPSSRREPSEYALMTGTKDRWTSSPTFLSRRG